MSSFKWASYPASGVFLVVFWNLVLKLIKLWKLLNLEHLIPDPPLNNLSHLKFESGGWMSSFYRFLVWSITHHTIAGTYNQTPRPAFLWSDIISSTNLLSSRSVRDSATTDTLRHKEDVVGWFCFLRWPSRVNFLRWPSFRWQSRASSHWQSPR